MRRLIIYTDGGSLRNPGPGAIGIVFCNEKGEVFKKYSEYLGETTNNEAEYKAIIFSLRKIKQLFGKKLAKNLEVEIRTDSELVVKQMRGEYKVLASEIQKLFLILWNLKLDFKKIKFKLIPREKNKVADSLVKEVLNSRGNQTPLAGL